LGVAGLLQFKRFQYGRHPPPRILREVDFDHPVAVKAQILLPTHRIVCLCNK